MDIKEPVILIRINRTYRENMSKGELYDATRGRWKIGRRREKAEYAFAVYMGKIVEVYKIHEWIPANKAIFKTSIHSNSRVPEERWVFIGEVADDEIGNKYRNQSVKEYFSKGNQNPIRYISC